MMADNLQQPMSLSRLLAGIVDLPAGQDVTVSGMTVDSRQVQPGDLFIALHGSQGHGRQYIDAALEAGAAAVLMEIEPGEVVAMPGLVPVIPVPGLRQQLGEIADRGFASPSARLMLTGVTGTNGKTSVALMLAACLEHLNQRPCGIIGTLGCGLRGELQPSANTTPDVVSINRQLSQLCSQKASDAVMEVSSHGLQQGRVDGLWFRSAIFTNLSRDHLDYHGSMQSYGEAKSTLFRMRGLQHAVINLDDPYGRGLLENLSADTQVTGFSMQDEHRFRFPRCQHLLRGEVVSCTRDGMTLQLSDGQQEVKVSSPMLGHIYAINMLCCAAALLARGFRLKQIAAALEQLPVVPGRMEQFRGNHRQPLVIVDYAHTPDGLKQALTSLREFTSGRLICVFGCGGDRDTGKRPLMGKIAAQLADQVVLTNDNPRTENPQQILRDIRAGMPAARTVEVVPDRKLAISQSIAGAGADDVILVAGKGHEDYQIIGTERLYFSDRELVAELLREGAA